jgi:hypothetical protein
MVISVLVTVLLLALTASVVGVSVTDARAVVETESLHRAFFLAEAGIDAAKYEINESTDPDGDGVGNKTVATPLGNYSVAAVQLDSVTWQLTSTGAAGLMTKILQVITRRELTTRFPGGAISIIGNSDKEKFSIKKHPDLIIDGGDNAALSFSDHSLAVHVGSEFAEAISKGEIEIDNLSGGVTDTYSHKGTQYELPIATDKDQDDWLDDIEAVYDNLVSHLNNTVIPSATTEDVSNGGLKDSLVYGSADQPVTVFLDGPHVRSKGQDIKGYGTLVVNELVLDQGSTLAWTGNVFVIGNTKKKAKLEAKGKDTTLNITGSLVVLGEGTEDAEIKFKDHAVANIDGAVFVGSGWDEKKGKKAKFAVEKDAEFNLTGMITVMGSKAEAKFKDGSDTNITGTLQMAILDTKAKDELKLEFQGDLEIHKDDDAIGEGMEAMQQLGVDIEFPEVEVLMDSGNLTTQLWTPIAS